MGEVDCFVGKVLIPAFLALLLTGCGNRERPVPSLPPDAVVLAFGDSLTFGSGAEPHRAYPAVLAELTGLRVINAGVPGERTEEGLARLPNLLKRHDPDLVILCHGGNDMLNNDPPERLRSNLEEMIALIRASGAEVLFVGVPTPSLWLKTAPVYAEIAQARRLPYEHDVISMVLKNRNLRSDQIHPNAEGYALIAEAVAEHLPVAAAP